jgi:hypothetical protein
MISTAFLALAALLEIPMVVRPVFYRGDFREVATSGDVARFIGYTAVLLLSLSVSDWTTYGDSIPEVTVRFVITVFWVAQCLWVARAVDRPVHGVVTTARVTVVAASNFAALAGLLYLITQEV